MHELRHCSRFRKIGNPFSHLNPVILNTHQRKWSRNLLFLACSESEAKVPGGPRRVVGAMYSPTYNVESPSHSGRCSWTRVDRAGRPPKMANFSSGTCPPPSTWPAAEPASCCRRATLRCRMGWTISSSWPSLQKASRVSLLVLRFSSNGFTPLQTRSFCVQERHDDLSPCHPQ